MNLKAIYRGVDGTITAQRSIAGQCYFLFCCIHQDTERQWWVHDAELEIPSLPGFRAA